MVRSAVRAVSVFVLVVSWVSVCALLWIAAIALSVRTARWIGWL